MRSERQRDLYVEHYVGDSFCAAKKVKAGHRHFMLGSSRVADMRLMGDDIGGISAVLEYRHPTWFVVSCGNENNVLMNEQEISELKISGGEAVSIGNHYLKFYLTDPKRELYSIESKEKEELNIQQILLVKNGDIIDTIFIPKNEKYIFSYGGNRLEFDPPRDTSWVINKFDDFIIQQRLTHKPEESARKKPNLKLIVNDAFSRNSATLVVLFMFTVIGMNLFTSKEEKVDENKFVQMIYDSKMMEDLKKEAQQVQEKRFVASNQESAAAEHTPEKQYVTKVVKNIRAKGLSKLIGRIAKRAAQDAVVFKSTGSFADSTERTVASTSTAVAGDKMKVSDKKYNLSKVGTVGKKGTAAMKSGSALARGNTAKGSVEVPEEEVVMDGGLDPEVIAAYIRSKIGQVRYCYERQLSGNPSLEGKVLVKFTIASDGKVLDRKVGKTTLKDAIVEGCILRRMATWKFPKPKGGTKVKVSYPFLFKSVN